MDMFSSLFKKEKVHASFACHGRELLTVEFTQGKKGKKQNDEDQNNALTVSLLLLDDNPTHSGLTLFLLQAFQDRTEFSFCR